MLNTNNTVTIAAPISNREDYIPTYLQCILNQTYPQELTSIYFLVNNSKDNSKKILQKFQQTYKKLFNKIVVEEYNDKSIPSSIDRQNRLRNEKIYQHLSYLRNRITRRCKTDWLFSVDSDIMLTPKALEKLMASRRKAISGLVCNGHEFIKNNPDATPYKYTNAMFLNPANKYTHFRLSQLKGIIDVDVTGAAMLMHKSIFKKCKYKYDDQGEDIPFCKDIKKLGEKIYCNCDVRLAHCMNLDLLKQYQNGEFTF